MPGYHGYTASHNKDGSVTFNYTPTLPGTYKLTALFNGEIPEGGELSCIVEISVEGYTTAYGAGDIEDLQNGVSIHRPEVDDPEEVEADPFQAVLVATAEGTGELHLVEEPDADLDLVEQVQSLEADSKPPLSVNILVDMENPGTCDFNQIDDQTASNVVYLTGDHLTSIKQEKSAAPSTQLLTEVDNSQVLSEPFTISQSPSEATVLTHSPSNASVTPTISTDGVIVSPEVIERSSEVIQGSSEVIERLYEVVQIEDTTVHKATSPNKNVTTQDPATATELALDNDEVMEEAQKPSVGKLPAVLKDASSQTSQEHEVEDVEAVSESESEKILSDVVSDDSAEESDYADVHIPESPRAARTPRRRGEFGCEESGCGQSFRYEYQFKKHKEAHARSRTLPKVEPKSPAKATPTRTFRTRSGVNISDTPKKKSDESISTATKKKRGDKISATPKIKTEETVSATPKKKPVIVSSTAPKKSGDNNSATPKRKSEDICDTPQNNSDDTPDTPQKNSDNISDTPEEARSTQSPLRNKRQKLEFICDEPSCCKSFPDKYKHQRHMSTHGEKQYTCDTPDCGKKYREKKSFIGHLQRLHRRTLEEESGLIVEYEPTEAEQKAAKSSKIKIKQEITESKEGDSLDGREGDSQDGESQDKDRPFSCEVCSKTFKKKPTLTNHMAIHGIGRFNCNICKKTFPAREKLNRHMTVHIQTSENQPMEIGDETMASEDPEWAPNADGEPIEPSKRVKWEFQCPHPVCYTRFKNRLTLIQHVVRMHGFEKVEAKDLVDGKVEIIEDEESQERCLECGLVCLDGPKLKRHLQIHNEARPFECPKCELAFRTAAVLRNHMAVHGEGKLPCPLCNKTFPSKIKLTRHMGSHPAEVGNYCLKCHVRYPEGEDADSHACVEATPTPRAFYQCLEEGCGESFKSKDKFCGHINRQHNSSKIALGSVEVFTCPNCAKVYASKLQLDNHFACHTDVRPYICEFCASGFKLQGALRVHLREQHGYFSKGKDTKPDIQGDPLRPYLCNYCGKAFKRKSRHKEHVAVHESTEQFECPTCHKTYPTMFLMKEHHRTIHPTTDYRIVCPYEGCNKVLKGFYSYAAHRNIHENRRWACTEPGCGRHFSTKNSMRLHVDYFHRAQEGAFPCEVEGCGKAFKSRENLRFHKMTHITERNFACEVCGKNFKTRVAVRVHSKIHYKECHIQCAFCDKTFTRKNRLKEHMLKHKDALVFQEIVI